MVNLITVDGATVSEAAVMPSAPILKVGTFFSTMTSSTWSMSSVLVPPKEEPEAGLEDADEAELSLSICSSSSNSSILAGDAMAAAKSLEAAGFILTKAMSTANLMEAAASILTGVASSGGFKVC